jgi:hypothetical protein
MEEKIVTTKQGEILTLIDEKKQLYRSEDGLTYKLKNGWYTMVGGRNTREQEMDFYRRHDNVVSFSRRDPASGPDQG